MGKPVQIRFEMPDDFSRFRLPEPVQRRLQSLLDLQDRGGSLSKEQREEAEALVNVVDLLTFLRLRAERSAAQ
jgi:hypothetical protein